MLRKVHYRDLDKYRRTKQIQQRRYYGKTQNAENQNQPWTEHDIQLVMEHKITDTELSALIGRSVSAIQKMRCKQKASEKENS